MILWSKTFAPSELSEHIESLENQLQKVETKQRLHATMLMEDFGVDFAKHNSEESLTMQVEKKLGEFYLKISQGGKSFNPIHDFSEEYGLLSLVDQEDPVVEIRRMLFQSYGDGIRYQRKGTRNIVTLKIKATATKTLYLTLISLILGFGAGGILPSLIAPEILEMFATYGITPVKTVFMNLLNFVMVPVVFLSVVTCVGGFNSFGELGRIGGKSMFFYMFTSVVAILIATGLYFLLPSFAQGIDVSLDSSALVVAEEVSFLDTFLGIFPDNILSPFLNADMLQLIFIGLFLGISLSIIGERGKLLLEIFQGGNHLFMAIMGIVVQFLPIFTFCTVFSTMMNYGLPVLRSLFGLFCSVILGMLMMFLFYGLMFFVVSKKSPLPLYRKGSVAVLTAFSLGSSNATIPTTLSVCEKKLGVPKKISSFTIPLGSIINMDGSCVFTMLNALFLAEVYGIPLTPAMLFSLGGIVFSISVGLPGMPGAILVGITMVAAHMGLPADSVAIVMGIANLMGMPRAATNVMGDVAVTLSVAASENQLDIQQYEN